MPQKFALKQYLPNSSRLVYGCMGLGGNWQRLPLTDGDIKQAHAVVETALEAGMTLFDHADIYTHGNAEETFSHLFKQNPALRSKMVLQTKCSIRFADEQHVGRYDQSKSYILKAVDASLKRLGTEYIDILLLHRPDALMEPEEVALAFEQLLKSGKVRHFGVSNMHSGQIKLLSRALEVPLIVNQLELSLLKHDWVDAGTTFNDDQSKTNRVLGDTIEHCRLENIQLQAWGSMANGLYTGAKIDSNRFNDKQNAALLATKELVTNLANLYGVGKEAIVLAWLLRHPAKIQPVIGTVNLDRIKACAQALTLELTREQWYQLYVTARGQALP
ncbi:aldo/keto reductase [Thorsellia anophelis]|uniref:Predicted oxidoreductase n=1 Tax=Thorsellia anophelis DSM 18579 TaxID=1123402 RepID=A0A1I0B189_9GAMM|nr:aldo/keto reductase [Thorsellia anophelis]SET00596.1 Predicted oxidoreductase [Thorsellia anophelis DSM 18579]